MPPRNTTKALVVIGNKYTPLILLNKRNRGRLI